ncbi:MAG: hypothetical protein LUH05_03160 [Candidatus Gastranaerophilales bacterium]|nr:hypothetical protein [Candidatus Gastranaerophilales bacterium]
MQDGILSDKAYVSTSIERNASMEGMIASHNEPYSTYKIHLPIGTQCGDLTYTSEREVLLPRNAEFKVLGWNDLEYILPKN